MGNVVKKSFQKVSKLHPHMWSHDMVKNNLTNSMQTNKSSPRQCGTGQNLKNERMKIIQNFRVYFWPSENGRRSVTSFPPPSFLHAIKKRQFGDIFSPLHMWSPLCDLFSGTLFSPQETPNTHTQTFTTSRLKKSNSKQASGLCHGARTRAGTGTHRVWYPT